jgi:hypothetical protein
MEKYPTPGYEGLYEITLCGRVFSCTRMVGHNKGGLKRLEGKELRVGKTKAGYPCINLHRENKTGLVYLHRVLAQLFIPNPEGKPTVNHINGDKSDFRLENLEWSTYSEQNSHAYRTGLKKAKSILTESQAIEALKLCRLGVSQDKVAKIMGVTRSCIQGVANRKTWKHLSPT